MSSTEPRRSTTDHLRVMELMKAIKSPDGYEPIPWSHIRWHFNEESVRVRLWAWMMSKTLKKGHWSAYAKETGRDGIEIELHLSHAAIALAEDGGNIRRAWREGEELGWWRRGTKKEGEKKLFICGNVPAVAQNGGEDTAKRKVCRNLLPGPISKQTKSWAPAKLQELTAWWERRQLLRDTVLREVVDVARDMLDEEDDTGLEGWGLAPSRNKPHRRPLPSGVNEIRRSRTAAIAPALKTFVQTSGEFAFTDEFPLYEAAFSRRTSSVSLLPETTPREQREERASGYSSAPQSRVGTPPHERQKPAGYQPAGEEPVFELHEKQAADLFYSELPRMQKAYKHADFAKEAVDRERKTDRIAVHRLVKIVSPEFTLPFLAEVATKFRGLDRNSLGKMPARAPGDPHGPRSLGLILEWARDFARERKIVNHCACRYCAGAAKGAGA